jgi:hypothetical protein
MKTGSKVKIEYGPEPGPDKSKIFGPEPGPSLERPAAPYLAHL